MKVLNLRCANGHGFEGWFASEDDFLDQNGRSMIECPLCADKIISRLPSAPRLNLSGAREVVPAKPLSPAASQAPAQAAEPQPADLQAHWLAGVRKLLASTEDVGPRFAEEARRIHYGEAKHRGIRGQASPEEREALRDEGIETVAIAVPHALDGPIQ
jgi:hypothetical protein